MAGPPIYQVLVGISVQENGDEGVLCLRTDEGLMPMFEVDTEKLESLRELAKQAAGVTGRPIKLVRFTTREELEVIE